MYTRRPSAAEILAPMSLPAGTTLAESLDLVLRLPSVCSKRFLTTKVDRHVTGAEKDIAGWSVSMSEKVLHPPSPQCAIPYLV